MYIDYDNCLVSLISSIEKHYGLDTSHSSLTALDKLLDHSYKNIILLLFDRMGTSILKKHLSSKSFLRKNLVDTISSVFPPTTTAATTSVITGKTPIEHGWLGWSLYFDKIDKTVELYPNTYHGEAAADYNVAQSFLPYNSIFERLKEKGIPSYFISPFSDIRAKDIDTLFSKARQLCDKPQIKYIYGYSPLPDYDMHDLGTDHPIIKKHIEKINKNAEGLCNELSDSLIIVTADHGMKDTKFVFMDAFPNIKQCLKREPSIEGRAMSLFVKDGMQSIFAELFNDAFGEIYELIPHDRAVSLFGDGVHHPLAEKFIGDFLAVAKTEISLSYEFDPSPFKAAHAGLTEDEINIPLIAIRT